MTSNTEMMFEKFQTQIEQAEVDIKRLEAKMKETSVEGKERWKDELEGLKSKRQTAKKELVKSKEAGEEVTEDIRKTLDQAVCNLQDSLNDARQRLSW